MRRIFWSLLMLGGLSACDSSTPSQALGTIERDRITLSATSNEIIRSLPMTEGSAVKQGQLLVQLDNLSQTAIVARAKAEQAKAQAYLLRLSNGERSEDIASAQAEVNRAQARVVEMQKSYLRAQQLVKQQLASQSSLDSALAERDSAQAGLAAAQEGFAKLTAGARFEDVEQAKAALDAARAEVALQQHKLDELSIVATRDGILDSLPFNLGERVTNNAVVAVLLADRLPYARVYVPQSYRAKLQPGQALTVHVDGVDRSFSGVVRWLATEPAFTPYYALTENERSRLMYLAEVDLEAAAGALPSGLPAQVDLPEASQYE
ncbi:HlyD family secretion protein [Agarivorans sp. QJM3NY_33]|uniref:HlyD family secretion protein n=1 Tax=Agarivorans sp. QJM3NY_33 TaxID=3421432 RepID=UPI003D7DB031